MQEKLMILKMLEDGKITAEQADKLLNSVGAGDTPPMTSSSPPPTPSTTSSYGSTPPSAYSGPGHNNRPPSSGGGGSHSSAPRTSSTFDDLSRKFESLKRDMTPTIQKATEAVAGAIAGAAEMVSGAFATPEPTTRSSTHQPVRPTSRTTAPTSTVGVKTMNVEMYVESGFSELSLSGLNGEIRIKGYNGDKITATISHRAKVNNAPIELMKLGGKYFLKYESDDFHVVSIDAYVPERAFGVIKIDGINCQIDCCSLAANEMLVMNANGSIKLAGIAAHNIKAEGSNGLFSITNVVAETAIIENMTGALDAGEMDVANLKLTNYNGPLSLIMSRFEQHSDYLWSIETGNAKLGMNLPTLPNLGYHIKAHAAMGSIRLGLTGLQYLINEPSLVEARTVNFDSMSKKVQMNVETSNAPLVIN